MASLRDLAVAILRARLARRRRRAAPQRPRRHPTPHPPRHQKPVDQSIPHYAGALHPWLVGTCNRLAYLQASSRHKGEG